jgi:hypothetical protein
MSVGPDSAPLLMALVLGVEAPVECKANIVSYFDPVITLVFGGNKAFIAASGYISIASLKTSCPRGLPQ